MHVTLRMGAAHNSVTIDTDHETATFDRTPLSFINRYGRLIYADSGKHLNRMISDTWARARG